MVRLFLEGGASIEKGGTKIINKIIRTQKNPSLIMLQWTSKNKKINLEKRKYIKKYFKSVGVKKFTYTEFSDSHKKVIEKMNKSNLIYLPGGDPRILYNTIKKKKLIKCLKQFNGTIFGGSAGALVQCKKYIIIDGQDMIKGTKTQAGIGLTDVMISVHYGSKIPYLSGNNQDKELKKISKKIGKIYAISEKSAIEIYNNKIKIHGKVYSFNNGRKTKL